MKLNYLKLINVRSYKFCTINFKSGITLLSGDIGAGKTTILHSIEFALFGLIRGQISGETLLRFGADSAKIELDFNINYLGKDISVNIVRVLTKTPSGITQKNGFLKIDDFVEKLSPIELKTKILQILGYPDELIKKNSLLYRYTVYTPQSSMGNILYESDDARLNIIRQIFNIDKYQTIKNNSIIYVRTLKNKISNYKAQLDLLKDVESKLDLLDDNIKNDSVKISQYLDKLEQIKLDFNNLELEFNKIQSLKIDKKSKLESINAIKKSILDYDKQISDITLKLDNLNLKQNKLNSVLKNYTKESILKNILDAEKEKNILTKSLVTLQTNLDTLQKLKSKYDLLTEKLNFIVNSLSDIIQKLENYKKQISFEKFKQTLYIYRLNELKKHLNSSNLDELYDNILAKITQIKSNINTNLTLKKQILDELSDIKNLDYCNHCKQTVSNEHKENISLKLNVKLKKIHSDLDKLYFEEKDMLKQQSDYKNRLLKLNENKLEHKHILKLLDLSNIKIDELKQTINKLESDKQNLNNNIDNLKKSIFDINKQLNSLDDKDTLNSQINSYHNDIDKIEQRLIKLNKLNVYYEKQNGIINLITTLSKTLTTYSSQKNDLISKLELLNKDIDTIDTKLTSYINEEKYTAVKEELLNINKTISELNTKITLNKNLKLELDKKVKLKQKIIQTIDSIRNIIIWFEEWFIPLMKKMEVTLLSTINNEFNSQFQTYFNTLIDDESLYVSSTSQFGLKIEQNGYDSSIQNLSGGEKTSVALSYRLALNSVINSFVPILNTKGLLVLDEPTDGLSSNQVDKLTELLNKLNLNQIILVSHDDKLINSVDNILNLEKHEHQTFISSY